MFSSLKPAIARYAAATMLVMAVAPMKAAAVRWLLDIAMSGLPKDAAILVNDEAFGSPGIEFENKRDRLD